MFKKILKIKKTRLKTKMIDKDFLEACQTGNIDYVKKHYKRWDIPIWNGNIGYGLFYACKENQREVINLLIDYIASLKDKYVYIGGFPTEQQYKEIISFALEGACIGNQVEVVKLLLDLGPNEYGIYRCGYLAKYHDKINIISLLKEKNIYRF